MLRPELSALASTYALHHVSKLSRGVLAICVALRACCFWAGRPELIGEASVSATVIRIAENLALPGGHNIPVFFCGFCQMGPCCAPSTPRRAGGSRTRLL
jgi:hypothetical protein